MSQPSSRHGLYASLIGSNPSKPKDDEFQQISTVYAESSNFSAVSKVYMGETMVLISDCVPERL